MTDVVVSMIGEIRFWSLLGEVGGKAQMLMLKEQRNKFHG